MITGNSPYKNTPNKGKYLDLLVKPRIEPSLDDEEYIIEPKYHHRPDKLAFERYGDANYLFVFQLRNMDIIKDYIFDFTAGTKIMVPSRNSVEGMDYGDWYTTKYFTWLFNIYI